VPKPVMLVEEVWEQNRQTKDSKYDGRNLEFQTEKAALRRVFSVLYKDKVVTF